MQKVNNYAEIASTMAMRQIYEYLDYGEKIKNFTSDTLSTKFYHVRRIAYEIELKDFRKLTKVDLRKWCMTKIEDGVKAKTINGHIDDLVGLLKFLKYQQDIKLSIIIESIDRFSNAKDEDIEDLPSFSRAEIENIRDHCESLLEEAVFSTLFDSAMRLCEITNMTVENIQRPDDSDVYLRITGKGRKRRPTFVLPETLAILEQWMTQAGITSGYIFPSPVRVDKPYTRENMRKIINRPIRRAGYALGGPHAIRRSALTIALDSGMSLPMVAKWAGHSDPSITLKHYYKTRTKTLMESHRAAMTLR